MRAIAARILLSAFSEERNFSFAPDFHNSDGIRMTDHSLQLQRDFDRFSAKDLSPEGGSCAWKIIELLQKRPTRTRIGRFNCVEQGTGVEPALTAWEAAVIPIYQPCIFYGLRRLPSGCASYSNTNRTKMQEVFSVYLPPRRKPMPCVIRVSTVSAISSADIVMPSASQSSSRPMLPALIKV